MRKYFIYTRLFFKTAVFFATVFYLSSIYSLKVSADNESSDYGHYTILLSQIRGTECCDAGSVENYKFQLDALKKFDLVGNFSLRYDVLYDSAFINLVKNDSKNEYGALLEVTPKLANDAGVIYKSDVSKWYEAQNAFLIGYSQEERKKLIDTYFNDFKNKMGYFPKFSGSWMIDAWSLSYLKSNYGILTHQITREQFGTDSYTLYGGPVHYPYFPSKNWAIIPDPSELEMPLIIRQTIMDPVFVYGDKTDSYTSQPNDYFFRNDTTEYFKHLFNQAHSQENDYTFALVGLENSMPTEAHIEYEKQLETMSNWKKLNEKNNIIKVSNFYNWLSRNHLNKKISVYHGTSHNDQNEQAWWINTSKYRARVRLSNGDLSITDLRVYDRGFVDPYHDEKAKSLGWWIVPFVLDGSRYFEGNLGGELIRNDSKKNNSQNFGKAIKILIASNVKNAYVEDVEGGKKIRTDQVDFLLFNDENIFFFSEPDFNSLSLLSKPLDGLNFYSSDGKKYWGFNYSNSKLQPFVNFTDLPRIRTEFRQLLFPEKQFEEISSKNSSIYVNNYYAQAGRNPVRLVFFPKNEKGEEILLPKYPQITTTEEIDDVIIYEQHQSNGMIFIDLINSKPKKVMTKVKYNDFEKNIALYFSPNCKNDFVYCIFHPRQAWWFVRNYLEDRERIKNEEIQKDKIYID